MMTAMVMMMMDTVKLTVEWMDKVVVHSLFVRCLA